MCKLWLQTRDVYFLYNILDTFIVGIFAIMFAWKVCAFRHDLFENWHGLPHENNVQ